MVAGLPAISILNRPSKECLLAAWTCLCLLCTGHAPAWAADAGEDAERPWSFGLSFGHGRQYNPFVDSDDIDIHLVVDLAWYGERFFFDNGDFGYTLAQGPAFSLNALATFNNERNYFSYLRNASSGLGTLTAHDDGAPGEPMPAQDGDAEFNATGNRNLWVGRANSALPKRRFALNAGLEWLYLSAWGDWQAQLLGDLSGVHDGYSAALSWTRPWYTERQEFALSLGMEWKSSHLVDYYYGVRPEEALPGRPAWWGGAGTNTFARVSAGHRITDHWKLVSVLEREFLSSAIQRSPIVDRDSIDTFYLGLLYEF